MSSPSRRDVLRTWVICLSTVAGTGCLSAIDHPASSTPSDETATVSPSSTPTQSPPPDQTTPTGTPGDAERIVVGVHNERSTAVTLTVTATAGNGQLLDAELTVPGAGADSVFSEITESGQYDVAVEVDDGTTGSARFSIGEYDVRLGSNAVVWIRDDEVELAKEE